MLLDFGEKTGFKQLSSLFPPVFVLSRTSFSSYRLRKAASTICLQNQQFCAVPLSIVCLKDTSMLIISNMLNKIVIEYHVPFSVCLC